MQVLVLGSGGKLGTLLRSAWPMGPDMKVTWHERAHFDILTDPTMLAEACKQHDCVVMLAGVTHHQTGKHLDDNARLAKAVLNASGNRRVLLASSAAVYGDQSGILSETRMLQPSSPYGIAKAAMEAIVADCPNATCLRIGNVAGADALLGCPRDDYFVHQFPDQTFVSRSYIGPRALATVVAALCACSSPLPPVLNVALPSAVSLAALMDSAGLQWIAKPAPPGTIATVELDTRLLEQTLKDVRLPSGPTAIIDDWRAAVGAVV